MAERGIDLTIFSPRASAMGHHIGPQLVPALRGDGRARRAGDGHVSAVTNKNFHATGSHYLNADTTAFMQLLQADLFTDFPRLRLVIPHGGGAVPYHWGRFRGLADMLDRPAPEDALMRNVSFDTCVYQQPGINLLFDVIGIDSILFGSEMVGAVRGIDPQTGHHFDDTRRYVEALDLTPRDRTAVFEANARRVYPRLHTALEARTLHAEVG
jgi:4-oxalmesaconate hydratase